MELEIPQEEEQKQQQIISTSGTVSGYLYAWGKSSRGCLGNGTEEGSENIPVRVSTNQKFVSLSTGGFFGCAVTQSGEVFTWGETKNGRNGFGSSQCLLIPKKIPNLFQIKQISCGNWHCLALNNSGQVFVSGHNSYGECGLNQKEDIGQFTLNDQLSVCITTISAGDGFSLFLDTDQRIYSCGNRLRTGNKEDAHQFSIKKISSLKDTKIVYINAGFSHAACVEEQTGEVYTWGAGSFGQLGTGKLKDEKIPVKVQNLSGLISVSCSRGEKYAHTMALNNRNELFTWGSGYKGKLGHQSKWSHEDPADEIVPRKVDNIQAAEINVLKPVAGGIHSAILTTNGFAMTFGCGSDGRLGHPEKEKYTYLYKEPLPRAIEGPFAGNPVIDLASSYYFMVAICQK